jgi:hypothetical protein
LLLLVILPLMSNREAVKSRLANPLGNTENGMELILRDLTLAGMVPTVGRGKRAPHYDVVHIKNVLLGASGSLPSRAADAVQALDNLVAKPANALHSNREVPRSITLGMSFGQWMIEQIEELAADKLRRDRIMMGTPLDLLSFRVSMSPTTPEVVVAEFEQGVGDAFAMFAPKAKRHTDTVFHTRRTVEIDIFVLAVAAELLADSWAKSTLTPTSGTPPQGGNAGDAAPKKKKAAEPASSNGLRLLGTTRHCVKTALLDKVQSMEKEGTGQPFSAGSDPDSLAGASFTIERKISWHASALPALPSGSPPTPVSRRPATVAFGTRR